MKISGKTKTTAAYLVCMALVFVAVKYIGAKLSIPSEIGRMFVWTLMIFVFILPLVYITKKAQKYDAIKAKENKNSIEEKD